MFAWVRLRLRGGGGFGQSPVGSRNHRVKRLCPEATKEVTHEMDPFGGRVGCLLCCDLPRRDARVVWQPPASDADFPRSTVWRTRLVEPLWRASEFAGLGASRDLAAG